MKCRFCKSEVKLPFIDLVNAPPSNSFIKFDQLNEPETYFPLSVFVCESCWLVQVDEYKRHDEIFGDKYTYYSSFSSSWLNHCKEYVYRMISRLNLTCNSSVLEVASNDGYLLQYFVEKGIPCLGVEPSSGTAEVARNKGIETIEKFWTQATALELVNEKGKFDLILANNVLAHVPDINDFVAAFSVAIADKGTITFEFPHLLNLIKQSQFDTIYHEHFSYLSLTTVQNILNSHKLTIYDVEEIPTHGGSLRVFARKKETISLIEGQSVKEILDKEELSDLKTAKGYRKLQVSADQIRSELLDFLIKAKMNGHKVAAYGAAAKGNTLLNYCGIKGTDLIQFIVDRNIHKQGLYTPGSHIPVVSEEVLRQESPDYLLILPWNIINELKVQLSYTSQWGGKLVTCIPRLHIH